MSAQSNNKNELLTTLDEKRCDVVDPHAGRCVHALGHVPDWIHLSEASTVWATPSKERPISGPYKPWGLRDRQA